MRSPDELIEAFRSRGLKATPQRHRIFRAMYEADGHPSAEEVWTTVRADLPSVSLKTVYATLGDLVAMGEIDQLCLDGGSSKYDPNVDGHHHLVCSECGSISDVAEWRVPVGLPAGDLGGFQVAATEVVYRGRCRDCLAGPVAAPSSPPGQPAS